MSKKLGVFGNDRVHLFFFKKYLENFAETKGFEIIDLNSEDPVTIEYLGCEVIFVNYCFLEQETLEFIKICGTQLEKSKILIFLSSTIDRQIFQRMKFSNFYYFIKSNSGHEFESLLRDLLDENNELKGTPGSSYINSFKGRDKRLSRREAQIANLISVGLRNFEIAEILDLSSSTVSTYRKRIFTKMGVYNNIQIAEAINHVKLTMI